MTPTQIEHAAKAFADKAAELASNDMLRWENLPEETRQQFLVCMGVALEAVEKSDGSS